MQITEEEMQSFKGGGDFLSNLVSFWFTRYGMLWRKSHSATIEGTRAGYCVCSGHQWIRILFILELTTFMFTSGTSQSRNIHGLLRVSIFKQKILSWRGCGSWGIEGCHEMVVKFSLLNSNLPATLSGINCPVLNRVVSLLENKMLILGSRQLVH